jgi:hypothetical protein
MIKSYYYCPVDVAVHSELLPPSMKGLAVTKSEANRVAALQITKKLSQLEHQTTLLKAALNNILNKRTTVHNKGE